MKRYGLWECHWGCVRCKHYLTRHQKYHSDGVCPHCGYKGRFACTIVDCKEIIMRKVYKHPAWMFWMFWYYTWEVKGEEHE